MDYDCCVVVGDSGQFKAEWSDPNNTFIHDRVVYAGCVRVGDSVIGETTSCSGKNGAVLHNEGDASVLSFDKPVVAIVLRDVYLVGDNITYKSTTDYDLYLHVESITVSGVGVTVNQADALTLTWPPCTVNDQLAIMEYIGNERLERIDRGLIVKPRVPYIPIHVMTNGNMFLIVGNCKMTVNGTETDTGTVSYEVKSRRLQSHGESLDTVDVCTVSLTELGYSLSSKKLMYIVGKECGDVRCTFAHNSIYAMSRRYSTNELEMCKYTPEDQIYTVDGTVDDRTIGAMYTYVDPSIALQYRSCLRGIDVTIVDESRNQAFNFGCFLRYDSSHFGVDRMLEALPNAMLDITRPPPFQRTPVLCSIRPPSPNIVDVDDIDYDDGKVKTPIRKEVPTRDGKGIRRSYMDDDVFASHFGRRGFKAMSEWRRFHDVHMKDKNIVGAVITSFSDNDHLFNELYKGFATMHRPMTSDDSTVLCKWMHLSFLSKWPMAMMLAAQILHELKVDFFQQIRNVKKGDKKKLAKILNDTNTWNTVITTKLTGFALKSVKQS